MTQKNLVLEQGFSYLDQHLNKLFNL